MTTVLLVMSICSFIMGLFFVFAKWSENLSILIYAKIIGLFGLLTPVIYWLYLLNILK